jgi:large subunit ribosomal protein L2
MKGFLLIIKKQLIFGFSRRSGRNFFGRKTIFTQGGGLKYKRRLIDYKRAIPFNFVLLSVEKQLRNTAYVGLVCYENGLFSYILLSDVHKVGNLIPGFLNFFKIGASTFLMNIPTGNFIHHIEQTPGCGAKLTRSAGTSSFVISKDMNAICLKMNSG